ncbi:hypothetical protein FHG87_020934 [Trinorchestia longiramus]|nr:hypothetical protein FHG87_020934 [Trinorchestia longiramus]
MMSGVCGSSGGAVIISAVASRSDATSALSGLNSDAMSESIVADSLESPQGGLSPSHNPLSSPQNLSSDDDDMPLSPESFDDDGGSSPYFSSNLDDVTAQLAAAGGWQGEIIP